MDDSEEVALIGLRLREGRRAKGITLDRLGEMTDLSSAFLSRLERGETSTSIGNLVRIAGAIGISLQEIFERNQLRSPPSYVLSKTGSRQRHGSLSGPGYIYQRFRGPLRGQRLEAFELEYPVGTNEQLPFLSHRGEEFLYLLSGKIEFEIGTERFVMERGDCIHLQASQPHRSYNIGHEPARLLMVIAPALEGSRRQDRQIAHSRPTAGKHVPPRNTAQAGRAGKTIKRRR